jgi:hypothetical protein
MLPTIGRILLFTVDKHTAEEMNKRNDGNSVSVGDKLPAIVVRTYGGSCVNLKVFRDAQSCYWITSVSEKSEGVTDRCWEWPTKV